jgi:HPr kinase/phosphorylase
LERKQVQLSQILEDCRDHLGLKLVGKAGGLDTAVADSGIGRPGLLLAGFPEGFQAGQMQVLDRAEILYLEKLDAEERTRRFQALLGQSIPCVIVSGGLTLPVDLVSVSDGARVPILRASASASEVVQYLNSYLLLRLAPETSINGTLVDVYGVGILLTGPSGIGKSECALALVGRGHRLVADDLIRTIVQPPGILVGRSSEPLQSYVEVRGIGLIHIGSIFGIRALRRQKRIEIEVRLRQWDKGVSYHRSGLESGNMEILGVTIPSMTVPLVPGKSVSVIVEVIALSHLLRIYGYDAAAAFDQRWLESVREKGESRFEGRDME